jgi:hypothetical protein
MNSMVATEAPEKEKPAAQHSLLETWGKNERMRHIPSVEWMTWKLDADLRRRIDKLLAPFATLSSDHPRYAPLETELRGLCRAIERFTDMVRHGRGGHAPQELPNRISWSIGQAVGALHSLDGNLFGRRYPFQTFERSKAEPIWGALLAIIDHTNRVLPLVRAIDPEIDARLYEGLVHLTTPMRETPMA